VQVQKDGSIRLLDQGDYMRDLSSDIDEAIKQATEHLREQWPNIYEMWFKDSEQEKPSTLTTQELDLNDDIIDVRGIIARVEDLEKQVPDNDNEFRVWEHAVEFDTLVEILEDLKGEGGDEQWRGDWYPVTLICEDYFTKYATELVCEVHDLGKLPHFIHIDWEATAREVKTDYSEVGVNGITYFYR
jgi:hypothetical protein